MTWFCPIVLYWVDVVPHFALTITMVPSQWLDVDVDEEKGKEDEEVEKGKEEEEEGRKEEGEVE